MKRFLSEITTVVERLSFNMSVKNVVRSINTDRPFEIPDDENEVLTILDDLGIIRSRVCPRTCSIDVYDAVLDKMRDGMARIDYAHIIQGKDIGLTIYQLNNVYYDRKRDLARCGRSWRLIAIYLKKSSIELFDNDQLEEIVNKATRADFRSSQKYKDALEYNLCDENGVLLVTKAKYTRFAVAKYKIDMSYKQGWEEFDKLFLDKKKGSPIPYRTFMQSYRDQGPNVIEQKNKKDFPELTKSKRGKPV
jgi:hypothetical protein